jgi:heme-degrading monooxygenase HmoA
MYARVMSTDLKKDTIDQAIKEWVQHIQPFKEEGLEQAFMLVDKETGRYLSITIWESEAAQRRNAESAGQSRGRDAMTRKYFSRPPTASSFEVAAVVK